MQIAALWWLLRALPIHTFSSRKSPLDMNNKSRLRPSHVQRTAVESVVFPSLIRADQDLPENVELLRLEKEIKAKFGVKTVQSCRWYQRQVDGTIAVIETTGCSEQGAQLVAFNQADDRFFCGEPLAAKNFALVAPTKTCDWSQPAQLFSQTPSITNAFEFPAIRLSRGSRGTQPEKEADPFPCRTDRSACFPCDVPCVDTSTNVPIVGNVYIMGTDWEFVFSMESASNYHQLWVDHDRSPNQFYATTSFHSEVPLPYFSWAEYNISQPALDYDEAIKGASFIARNCNSKNGREAVVKDLQKFIRVDSLSRCLHNADPPNHLARNDDKRLLQRQYLFHLAFENSKEEDYVTEKMWGTYESGTLPIYFGAPNILEHVPEKSIISVHDFPTTKELGLFLQKVMADKALYESYHEWRTKPLPESFLYKYNFTHTHSTCRLCRWAYARLYGQGWNHETQSIEDMSAGRQLNFDDDGLIASPLKEILSTQEGAEVVLRKEDSSAARELLANSWRRIAHEHDGVIDIHLKRTLGASSILRYRLESQVKGDVVRSSKDRTMWQDARHRITVLTSWDATMRAHDGCIEVTLDQSAPSIARIRVVIELVDTLHASSKHRDEPSYFGKRVADEFELPPIEVFRIK
jgi:hypothetical protein